MFERLTRWVRQVSARPSTVRRADTWRIDPLTGVETTQVMLRKEDVLFAYDARDEAFREIDAGGDFVPGGRAVDAYSAVHYLGVIRQRYGDVRWVEEATVVGRPPHARRRVRRVILPPYDLSLVSAPDDTAERRTEAPPPGGG